jgi:hypothetical protein
VALGDLMLRKILGALRSPYPYEPSPMSILAYGLGCGFFIFFFFTLLEPLGFSLLPGAPRRTFYIGYGLVTGLAIVLNGLLLPRLWPRFFREENWSLGRQILWMGWVTLTIGLGCYLLSRVICAYYGLPAHWVQVRTIMLDTFIIAIFPITVINLANYARLLCRNARVVQEANRRLWRPGAQPQPGEREAPATVVMVAENNKDMFRVALDDLLFIQAGENYVQIHVKGAKPGRVLLRSGLTRIERQLRPFHPRLFRCHRAYIIQMSQIARVEGNAQGLKLALKDAGNVIPVARRYVADFRRVIHGL